MEKVDHRLEEVLKGSIGLTLSLPEDIMEGILLLLYCVKKIGISRLMKMLAISHLKFRIPYNLRLGISHFGLMNHSLHRYLRLMVEEGFVKVTNEETPGGKKRTFYELTENGRKYVTTTILPWEDVSRYENGLAFLLSLPTNSLIEYSNYVAGFLTEKVGGMFFVLKAAFLEDFQNPNFTSPRCRIIINSLLMTHHTIRKIFKGSLATAPPFDARALSSRKMIKGNLEDILVKRAPTHCHSHLIELKNCVLNRFLYVLAIYLVNIIDARPATLEEIKCLTHDHYLDAYRNLLFQKYLTKEERNRYKRQKKLSNKRIQRDLTILERFGFIRDIKIDDRHYYVATAKVFVSEKNELHLPEPDWLKETYQVFIDEAAFLEHKLNALRRGYYSY